jgi:hypothetical protein
MKNTIQNHKKNYAIFLLIIIFFSLSTNYKALSQTKIYPFFAETDDDFYWKETRFMCDISPLSLLSSYKYIYEEYGDCEINYGLPMFQDKNYLAFWTIIDSMLYLYDVKNDCTHDSSEYNNFKPDNIEKFLNAKFSKDFLPVSERENERFKNGVIPAIWFTDTLYIKRYPKEGEHYWESEYDNESFTRLVFDKGRLMEEKQVECIERRDKSYYPKEKLIIQKSDRKIICMTDSMSISIPFCIDRKNIKRIEDNFDDNNRCITLALNNKPKMILLSEVCKGENYKNCIYMIDDEVITADPALFMIEKSIIYKLETEKLSEPEQDIIIVKIRTKPEKEDEFMTSLTF